LHLQNAVQEWEYLLQKHANVEQHDVQPQLMSFMTSGGAGWISGGIWIGCSFVSVISHP
jgi:hypothetical protein